METVNDLSKRLAVAKERYAGFLQSAESAEWLKKAQEAGFDDRDILILLVDRAIGIANHYMAQAEILADFVRIITPPSVKETAETLTKGFDSRKLWKQTLN